MFRHGPIGGVGFNAALLCSHRSRILLNVACFCINTHRNDPFPSQKSGFSFRARRSGRARLLVSAGKFLHLPSKLPVKCPSFLSGAAPALVAHLPHDARTNLAYPSLPANVFSEGQIRPVIYEICFSPQFPPQVIS